MSAGAGLDLEIVSVKMGRINPRDNSEMKIIKLSSLPKRRILTV